jgi:hypothetical protein
MNSPSDRRPPNANYDPVASLAPAALDELDGIIKSKMFPQAVIALREIDPSQGLSDALIAVDQRACALGVSFEPPAPVLDDVMTKAQSFGTDLQAIEAVWERWYRRTDASAGCDHRLKQIFTRPKL